MLPLPILIRVGQDYVDGWHVETAEGEILGTRILLHPHVGEQPFTRSS